MGKYSRYEDTANVFDRNRSWAGIRKERAGAGKTTNTQIVYDDVLCHDGWGVGPVSDELAHFGIKGQKWGIRRFQNEDGSLTEEGKQRYNAGYKWGTKAYETDNLKARALVGLGLKGTLKYGKYVRDKDRKAFEDKYGKTKEEQEKNLKKEWDELTKKETADLELGKKMDKFDKLSSKEQDQVLNETKKEIDRLMQKNQKEHGLDHDDRKTLDGLEDWYQTTKREKAFKDSKSDIDKYGLFKWLEKSKGTDKMYDVFEHICDKHNDVLTDWYKKRETVRGDLEAGNRLQDQYVKKLAKAIGIAPSDDNLYVLRDWFIFFDD